MKTCEACGTENDDTRVFCHNCGARLPAPAPGSLPGVPKKASSVVGASAPPISPVQAGGRSIKPGKIPQARRGFFSTLFGLLPWILLAGFAFGLFLVFQPPANIPAPVEPDPAESERLGAFLQQAAQTPGGAWQGEQTAVNRFLTANVQLAPVANALGIKSRFERCFVVFGTNQLDFTLQIALFDRDLYLTLRLAPSTESGRLQPRVLGAQLGRLPVPAPLANLLLPIWSPCADSLSAVMDLLQKAESAEVQPGRLVIRWPGASQATP